MLGSLLVWGLTATFVAAALVGFLFLTPGTGGQRVSGLSVDRPPVAPEEPELPPRGAVVAGTPPDAG